MAKQSIKKDGPVYSTDKGGSCPDCKQPASKGLCRVHQPPAVNDGVVRVSRATKGRKGAGVSLISGLPAEQDELKILARQLKQKCGSGGTVKNGIIEIQGDHRQVLVAELEKMGYKPKLAGG